MARKGLLFILLLLAAAGCQFSPHRIAADGHPAVVPTAWGPVVPPVRAEAEAGVPPEPPAGYEVTLYACGFLWRLTDPHPPPSEPLTRAEAWEVAREFVRRYGGLPANAVLARVFRTDPTPDDRAAAYCFYLTPRPLNINGFGFLEDGITVLVRDRNVVYYRRCWYNPREILNDEARPVIPARDVLAGLRARGLWPAETPPTRVSLLYRAGNPAAAAVILKPVWYFEAGPGVCAVVDAWTGEPVPFSWPHA
ncbi:MAG: hypothetical protein ACUVTQ_04385 [Desulfotomaculales bacterium]